MSDATRAIVVGVAIGVASLLLSQLIINRSATVRGIIGKGD